MPFLLLVGIGDYFFFLFSVSIFGIQDVLQLLLDVLGTEIDLQLEPKGHVVGHLVDPVVAAEVVLGFVSGPGDLGSSDRFYPERELGKASGRVDVAKINHHGHHSMPSELVRDLQARVYVACIWDQLHVTDDTMTRIADATLYPGERTIFPGVMTAERRAKEADRPWMHDVPKAVYEGSHIVSEALSDFI